MNNSHSPRPSTPPAVAPVREAVGIFDDAERMEAAVKDLESSGFDRADISLLARAEAVRNYLGGKPASASSLADDPDAPRESFVPSEAADQETAMLGGMLGAIGGMAAAGAVVATGGTLAAVIGAATLAAGAGGLIGSAAGQYLGEPTARMLDENLERGGLLLWVRTDTPDLERQAVSVLTRHGGREVHVHTFKSE